MSLPEDVLDNIRGFTRAMYSTWFFFRPGHFLLDAGEGMSAKLGNLVYGIENVFLSHGHYDHIGGVPGLVLARNAAMGERTKPLSIYHPKGDNLIQLEREYVSMLAKPLDYELSWKPLSAGDSVDISAGSGKWKVKTFATAHARNRLTLGYNLVESRKRLRGEFAGKPEGEISEAARSLGREAVMEEYEQIILSYTGDSAPVEPDSVRGANVLMHDTTFLDDEERKSGIHATLGEVLEVARMAGVKGLGLFHVSSRYTHAGLEERVSKEVAASGLEIPVTLFHLRKKLKIR